MRHISRSSELTEDVDVPAVPAVPRGHLGVRPQDAVGAGHQVLPDVLVIRGVQVDC